MKSSDNDTANIELTNSHLFSTINKSILLVYIVPIVNLILLIYEIIIAYDSRYSFIFLFLNCASVINATNTGISCTMGGLKSYDENNELMKNRNISISVSSILFIGSYMLLRGDNYKNPKSSYGGNVFLMTVIVIITIIITIMIIKDYIRVINYQSELVKKDVEQKPTPADQEAIKEMLETEKTTVEGEEYNA